MALTALDTATALIIIDLQKGVVALPPPSMADVVQNSTTLAAAFRARGLPVVLVNVTALPPGRTEQPKPPQPFPPGWADLVAELDPQPQDHLVTKRTPGAFTGTGLEALLKAEGITQLVITGVATSNGVEVTARQAYELGFNVTLATDAMTDTRPDAHDWCVTRVFPRIGETGTTRDIIDLLAQQGDQE